MSFSSEVKQELFANIASAAHCQRSELAALFMTQHVSMSGFGEDEHLSFMTENESIAKKVFTILKKTFNINNGLVFRKIKGKAKPAYGFSLYGNDYIRYFLYKLSLQWDYNSSSLKFLGKDEKMRSCCKYAFLRGVYLSNGSMNDPAKSYHLEFTVYNDYIVELVAQMLSGLTEDAKISKRNNSSYVYIKEAESIADVLAAMGASKSMLSFENTRIVNETRGLVNRRVNCEVGNLKKSAAAGASQVEDIKLIEKVMGLEKLPESLREIARVRLANPEASLSELGEMLSQPLGRSGVNHRLQRLVEIAKGLRNS